MGRSFQVSVSIHSSLPNILVFVFAGLLFVLSLSSPAICLSCLLSLPAFCLSCLLSWGLPLVCLVFCLGLRSVCLVFCLGLPSVCLVFYLGLGVFFSFGASSSSYGISSSSSSYVIQTPPVRCVRFCTFLDVFAGQSGRKAP